MPALGGDVRLYLEDGFHFQSEARPQQPPAWAHRHLAPAELHELVLLQQRARVEGVVRIHQGLLVARHCLYGTGLIPAPSPS